MKNKELTTKEEILSGLKNLKNLSSVHDEEGEYSVLLGAIQLIESLQDEVNFLKADREVDKCIIENLRKDLEKRVEEVYPQFMRDYKQMSIKLEETKNRLYDCEKKYAGEIDIEKATAQRIVSWVEADSRLIIGRLRELVNNIVEFYDVELGKQPTERKLERYEFEELEQ